MNIISIIILSIGLSMDTFAVSITSGFTIRELKIKKILTISLCFSFFQAFMPVIGWLAGLGLKIYIMAIDHWIAFFLLSLIGLKMIYEGIKKRNENKENKKTEMNILNLIGLSIATSIDALVIGISFAFMDTSIILSILIIGLVTFLFSISGIYIGKLYGQKIDKKIEIIGGLILIGLGTKILLEHIFAPMLV